MQHAAAAAEPALGGPQVMEFVEHMSALESKFEKKEKKNPRTRTRPVAVRLTSAALNQ